jgi:ParB family transcriptional regulator, chromosome partitioning protein
MTNDDTAPKGARKKQIKFSGLVKGGVISPQYNPEQADADFSAENGQSNVAKQVVASRSTTTTESTIRIPLHLIDDSPFQSSNRRYDPEELDELARAIETAGQQEPVQVRKKLDGRFELIAGHRRVRAIHSSGGADINAILIVKNDREAELATMVHNEGRKNLCDFEKGKLFQRAMTRDFASSQTKVAELFATTQTTVSRCQAMLKLPDLFLQILEAQPDLFNSVTAKTIAELLIAYPAQQDLVEKAVLRIKDGAAESSIKGWVDQMARQQNQATPANKPKIITSATGQQMFSAKRDGRIIMVRISSHDVDGDAALQKIVESLRQFTDSNNKEI